MLHISLFFLFLVGKNFNLQGLILIFFNRFDLLFFLLQRKQKGPKKG